MKALNSDRIIIEEAFLRAADFYRGEKIYTTEDTALLVKIEAIKSRTLDQPTLKKLSLIKRTFNRASNSSYTLLKLLKLIDSFVGSQIKKNLVELSEKPDLLSERKKRLETMKAESAKLQKDETADINKPRSNLTGALSPVPLDKHVEFATKDIGHSTTMNDSAFQSIINPLRENPEKMIPLLKELAHSRKTGSPPRNHGIASRILASPQYEREFLKQSQRILTNAVNDKKLSYKEFLNGLALLDVIPKFENKMNSQEILENIQNQMTYIEVQLPTNEKNIEIVQKRLRTGNQELERARSELKEYKQSQKIRGISPETLQNKQIEIKEKIERIVNKNNQLEKLLKDLRKQKLQLKKKSFILKFEKAFI